MKQFMRRLFYCWDLLRSPHFFVFTANKKNRHYAMECFGSDLFHIKEWIDKQIEQERALMEAERILNP